MLTLFAYPKAFNGHIGMIQRNAIKSWLKLRPRCEIFLFGSDPGVAEVSKEYHIEHVPEIAHNEFGTPLLSDVFEKGTQLSTAELSCYINCDILLTAEFMRGVERTKSSFKKFLLIGECVDLNVSEPLNFDQPAWENRLRASVRERGNRRGLVAMDYFVFPRDLYGTIPNFALGRATFDNWLVWRARNLKVPVVDATKAVLAVHQNHDYRHVAGGKDYTRFGQEAKRNLEMGGGKKHYYTLFDSTHRLTESGLERNTGAYFRFDFRWQRFKARNVAMMWKVLEFTRPARHTLRLRKATFEKFRTR